MKTKVRTLCPFLELATKHPWKELQRQSLELRRKDGPSRDCHTQDPSHNQPPNANTIAHTSKMLLKGPWCSCLWWGYVKAQQTHKWSLAVSYWMDHRAPNGGARESTQWAKGICNPIGGTTIWTNQYPRALDSSCVCIKRLPSRPSMEREAHSTANFICPSTGERQGQKGGVGG